MPSLRMRRWPLGRLALGAVLSLVAGALLSGPATSQPEPKLPPRLPLDLKLVPTDASAFVTIRVADLKDLPAFDKVLPAVGGELVRTWGELLAGASLPAE